VILPNDGREVPDHFARQSADATAVAVRAGEPPQAPWYVNDLGMWTHTAPPGDKYERVPGTKKVNPLPFR